MSDLKEFFEGWRCGFITGVSTVVLVLLILELC